MLKYLFFQLYVAFATSTFNSCSDADLAYDCVEYCASQRSNCIETCEDDQDCILACDVSAASCTNSCPCFENCPTGCDGCNTPFCSCTDLTSNEDYISCTEYFEAQYTDCIVSCDAGDVICLASCARQLDLNKELCPCQSDCPNGCPCPNYQCSESTTPRPTTQTTASDTRKDTVLVLNTHDWQKNQERTSIFSELNWSCFKSV